MTVVKRRNCEKFKRTITIDEGKERLRIHIRYGWNFLDHLHTPRRNLELDKWGTFVENFKTILDNLQELIIKKYMGEWKCGVYNYNVGGTAMMGGMFFRNL